MIHKCWLFVLMLFFPTLIMANGYIGHWKTLNEDTGEPQSIVYIWEEQAQLKGRIHTILQEQDKGALCRQCEGELKNRKVEGMTFIWGMEPSGDKYDDGHILDPESGKTYDASLKLIENGTKLEVHGYLGFALLGRTQIWERVK